MKKYLLVVLVVAMAAACWAQSPGKLERLGKYPATTGELQVSTYQEGTERVGVLGIWKEQPPRAAAAFRLSDWDELIKLWQKASVVESPSWHHVGVYKETGTKDPTLLTVSAGPGVRLVMETEGGLFSVVLSRSDYASFERNLQAVRRFLAEQ